MTAKEFLIERKVPSEGDNLVEVPPFVLEVWLQQYAHIKCLEAIKNTRYQAIDIITHDISSQFNMPVEENDVHALIRNIQNIPNQDVMPEL